MSLKKVSLAHISFKSRKERVQTWGSIIFIQGFFFGIIKAFIKFELLYKNNSQMLQI